jgi:hemoglobin-like flavoprotein
MTPEQIRLVQISFQKIVPVSNLAARLFYSRLFELDPSLRSLVTGNMQEREQKLITTVQLVVEGLDRPDEIIPAIKQLGQQSARFGLRSRDYDTVGKALLWTLAKGLGVTFTPPIKAAWVVACELLIATLKEAAATAA